MMNKKIVGSILAISFALMPLSAQAMTKDETVYSTLNKQGELYKTTVVNHLYQAEDQETMEDITELKEILNINGKEKFTINGKNITWNNQGKEIFYQGTIEKELPIKTEVKYYLDGKELSEKELIGKQGKIKIVIQLKNIDSHKVVVNNQEQTLYTPFVVTAGTIISGKNNSNLEVSNGKVVNTGSKNLVVSLATPGLYDSLGLKEFQNMDTITIQYDTKSYKENTIYLVATPKLIDSTDLQIFDKLNRVYHDVNSLQENMNTIESGVVTLEDGASKLASGSKEISNNLWNVVSYMKQLENGSIELENGLNQVITSLEEAKNQLENSDATTSIASLKELQVGNSSAIEKLTNTNNTIKTLFLTNRINIDDITIDQLPEDLRTYKQTYDGNQSIINLLTLNNSAINQTIATTMTTTQTIGNLLTQLQNALQKLHTGASTLYSSTTQIRNGIEQLYQGSITLSEGANALYSGTTTLKNGITTYNQEGIQKLSASANQAKNMTNKLEALTKLSNDYKGFAADNIDSTTFVSVIK